MTSIRLGLVLAVACAVTGPFPVAAQGPLLELVIVHLVPGPQRLNKFQWPSRSEDDEMLERYGVTGTSIGTLQCSVESPTGLDSRMIIFIQRPLTCDEQTVRLPVPDSGREFVSQGPPGCWEVFPADTVHRLEHFVTLRMKPLSPGATELHMLFEVVGANGDVQRGVAARWAAAAVSSDAIQLTHAAERAQRDRSVYP